MIHFALKNSKLAPYLGDRAFYKSALLVMIPVILQQLVNAMFNFVDNVMVASIDELSMVAVTVANRPAMLYYALFFGFTGAAGLLLSQYYGANRLDVCQRIFSVEMLLGFAFSLLFALAMGLFPEQVMRFFVTDEYTISVGVAYLRVVVWAYLPAAVSSVCVFSLRSLGINLLPMVVSMLAIATSAFLNWVLIFGNLGMPRMGVQGAALGTLLGRVLEMCIYVVVLLTKKTPFSLNLYHARRIGRPVMRDYVGKALPLTCNEILWSSGLMIFFWAYTRINEAALPAINVMDQVFNISWVFFMGMSSAISVMVGKQLGAGEFGLAKQNAKRLYGLGLMISAVCIVVSLGVVQVVGGIFPKLSPPQIPLAKQMIYIMVCFFPTSATYAISFFLLRAGGDTKNAMLLDSVYMWVIPVPVALVMAIAFSGRIDVRLAMLIIQLLMNLKVIWAVRIVKRGTWLRNLTMP
ncbi:MAG: MATE family efflux transporter [Clostridia bacterium]|nr:MATE family efflux transporter [Clostridia bacterium]